jgi:omega-6 fatty acid desaturase (delta-12 desaturase)
VTATLTLGRVREAFPARCYERSPWRTWTALAFDVVIYGAALAGALVLDGVLPRLACGAVAGLATAALFVWAHDATHGALLGAGRWARALSTAAMLPSLQVERLWAYGHNRVHHGFTSLSTVDWIWRPWTPAAYAAATPRARLLYRLERHPATCGLHYLLRVWWPGMVRFSRPGAHLSKAVVVAFAAGLTTAAWTLGGPVSVLAALVVPFAVFTYTIALFVYLHHTHPDVPFFDDRATWSAVRGQLDCSTTIRTSWLAERLTHGILVHTPHHVDTRIPFYRLPEAAAALLAEHGDRVVTYRFRWGTVRRIFATCQLFDFDTGTWSTFTSA